MQIGYVVVAFAMLGWIVWKVERIEKEAIAARKLSAAVAKQLGLID